MMNTKTISGLIWMLATAPVFGQTIYKCPKPDGTTMIQQMPCSIQGGGETMTVKPIPTGAGSGLSEGGKAYLEERNQYRSEEAKANTEENQRRESLAAEHRKAKAAEEQAAAQRATANAIWMTGRRY